MANITRDIIMDAINTNTEEFCNSDHVGQVTFWVISVYDSFKNSTTLAIFYSA